MPEKDPNNWLAANYALPLLAGGGGGLVRYFELIKRGRTFRFTEFLCDMFSSIFVGWALFILADALQQPQELCAVCAAIGGNMGARAFQIIEHWIAEKAGAFQKKDKKDEEEE